MKRRFGEKKKKKYKLYIYIYYFSTCKYIPRGCKLSTPRHRTAIKFVILFGIFSLYIYKMREVQCVYCIAIRKRTYLRIIFFKQKTEKKKKIFGRCILVYRVRQRLLRIGHVFFLYKNAVVLYQGCRTIRYCVSNKTFWFVFIFRACRQIC